MKCKSRKFEKHLGTPEDRPTCPNNGGGGVEKVGAGENLPDQPKIEKVGAATFAGATKFLKENLLWIEELCDVLYVQEASAEHGKP